MTVYGDTLAETLTMTGDVVGVDQGTTISQGLGVSPFLSVVRAAAATASETIDITPALTMSYGQAVVERLRISLAQITNQYAQLSLEDTASFAEEMIVGYPMAVSETVGMAVDQLVQQVTAVIEALQLQGTLAPALIYNKSISDTLSLADTLARFFGAEATDTIGVAEVLSGIASMPATVAEGVGVAESITPQMVLRVTASDEIDISAVEALNMIFEPTLVDGIEITAAYLSPGGGILTWAMNTRTGAVTEYQNYAFNSFAKLGNKYVGASSSGLYELLGDDDDGTSIVATIRSGFAQWSGTHLGSFKAAYLAARGAGQFVLRVITGDGKTYNYTVTAESMKTTKVNMGKGLRARYFAFELVSAGQDFDLDTLEFIPLVADRRI